MKGKYVNGNDVAQILSSLEELERICTFETASFGHYPLPENAFESQKARDEYIKNSIRLYIGTWIGIEINKIKKSIT